MKTRTKIYFASDVHLGLPDYEKSREREKLFVKWLSQVSKDAKEIYLMGDIFDFWFEYKKVVPRGFTRLLGKISEITDAGIPIHFFTGNHDLWIFDYLPNETGVILHKNPIEKSFNGKKFYLAHGDGLGPYDKGYKLLKIVFTSKTLQWLFARLHPNFALALAHSWSRSRRYIMIEADDFRGEEKEWLLLYAKDILKKQHFDYMIFGHRHIAINIEIGDKCRYINLGDWISKFTYGVFDGNTFELKKFV